MEGGVIPSKNLCLGSLLDPALGAGGTLSSFPLPTNRSEAGTPFAFVLSLTPCSEAWPFPTPSPGCGALTHSELGCWPRSTAFGFRSFPWDLLTGDCGGGGRVGAGLGPASAFRQPGNLVVSLKRRFAPEAHQTGRPVRGGLLQRRTSRRLFSPPPLPLLPSLSQILPPPPLLSSLREAQTSAQLDAKEGGRRQRRRSCPLTGRETPSVGKGELRQERPWLARCGARSRAALTPQRLAARSHVLRGKNTGEGGLGGFVLIKPRPISF